jgi:hypothetical protein
MSAVFPEETGFMGESREAYSTNVWIVKTKKTDQKNRPKNGLPPSDVNWHSLWN